jgi:Protein of unknown function (DUF2726)
MFDNVTTSHLGGPFLLLGVLAVVILALQQAVELSGKRSYKFTKAPILTANEQRLLRRLLQEFPHLHVFPQVSMGAVLKPLYAERDRRHLAAFRTISQKRVDFIVCDRRLNVPCLLELDDSSHRRYKDNARDRITGGAGFQTVRLRSAKVIDLSPLHDLIGRAETERTETTATV